MLGILKHPWISFFSFKKRKFLISKYWWVHNKLWTFPCQSFYLSRPLRTRPPPSTTCASITVYNIAFSTKYGLYIRSQDTMVSTLRLCLLAVTLFFNFSSAFPLISREVQWSFTLFPSPSCNGTIGDPHVGSGSTGCRADLHSVASAYTLNSVADGCRIELFDNTMCDQNELSDIASQANATQTCHIAEARRRYGSYQVTCA